MKALLLSTVLFLLITVIFGQTSGLITHLPFNGNANDASEFGNHGTVYGATLTTDRFGNNNSAYSFDGIDDYIECLQPGPIGTNPRTITFWAKTDAVAKPNQSNVALSYGASSNSFNYGDRLEINLNAGANGLTLTVGGAYLTKEFDNTDANWHHYAIVFEGGTNKKMGDFKFYADGEPITNVTGSVDHGHTINTSATYNLTIGMLHAYGRHFKGDIDDIKIFDRALTDDEIKNSYSDLLAYYPFNGNANDLSGYNHHGTVNGATLTTDRFGNIDGAYEFDGINDFISIPQSPSLNIENELSISVWIKPTAFPTSGNMMILGKSNYTSATNYLLRIKPNGFLQFEYKTFANSSDNPLLLNQWNHVVVTSNTSNEKQVYVNNVLAAHTSQSSPFGLVSNPVTIGAASYNSEYFNGSIDDVKIYQKALSDADVAQLYNTISTQLPKFLNTQISYLVFNKTLLFENLHNLNEIISVSVFDIKGQQIMDIREITNPIDLGFLNKGIYFATVRKRDQSLETLKFIID
jgi:hypothetical protein